jgi:hypothetical protein
MTVRASDLSMFGFQERRIHENFFVQLQRGQWPPSSLARCFSRLACIRFDPFHFPSESDKALYIGMTSYTLTVRLCFPGKSSVFTQTDPNRQATNKARDRQDGIRIGLQRKHPFRHLVSRMRNPVDCFSGSLLSLSVYYFFLKRRAQKLVRELKTGIPMSVNM